MQLLGRKGSLWLGMLVEKSTKSFDKSTIVFFYAKGAEATQISWNCQHAFGGVLDLSWRNQIIHSPTCHEIPNCQTFLKAGVSNLSESRSCRFEQWTGLWPNRWGLTKSFGATTRQESCWQVSLWTSKTAVWYFPNSFQCRGTSQWHWQGLTALDAQSALVRQNFVKLDGLKCWCHSVIFKRRERRGKGEYGWWTPHRMYKTL